MLRGSVQRRLSFAGRPIVAVIVLLACLGSGARADALSAGANAYAHRDYVRAAPLLLVAAERGSPQAQTYLGYMYQYGLGVPQNYFAAAGWLSEAAQQGEPTAQFMLGLLFDKGFGVPQDWVQAEVWLILAAGQAPAAQRDYWERVRNAVAEKLTLDQLAEAQKRAFVWSPIPFHASPTRAPSAPLSARY